MIFCSYIQQFIIATEEDPCGQNILQKLFLVLQQISSASVLFSLITDIANKSNPYSIIHYISMKYSRVLCLCWMRVLCFSSVYIDNHTTYASSFPTLSSMHQCTGNVHFESLFAKLWESSCLLLVDIVFPCHFWESMNCQWSWFLF